MRSKLIIGTLSAVMLSSACGTDALDDDWADDGGKQDTSGRATTVAYATFVTNFFETTSLLRKQELDYVGRHEGATCTVALRYSGAPSASGYSEFDFDIMQNPNVEDFLSGVQVQKGDKIKKRSLGGGSYELAFDDKSCGGTSQVTAAFSDGPFASKLTSISATVSENSCGVQDKFTEHRWACEELKLSYEPSAAGQRAMTQLIKAAFVDDATVARRFTDSRFQGCHPDAHEGGNIVCMWDVSDDPDGDSGDLMAGSFRIQDGTPVELVKTWTIDKFSGDFANPT